MWEVRVVIGMVSIVQRVEKLSTTERCQIQNRLTQSLIEQILIQELTCFPAPVHRHAAEVNWRL